VGDVDNWVGILGGGGEPRVSLDAVEKTSL
jgi:hypothetical protein